MASEDSVENLILRDPPVLAIPIDGVGKSNELHESLASAVSALIHKPDDSREDLVVACTCGKPHVVTEERHNSVPKDLAIRDLEHKHIFIPRLREYRA